MKAGLKAVLAGTLAVAAIGAIAAPAGASGATTKVSSKSKCELTLSEARNLGASYVTTLKTKNTSCGDGKKVIAAFHGCRRDNGGADGRCKKKVKGYKCNEGSREGVPGVQYSAKVTCKSGSKKIVSEYTMNL